MFEAVARMKTDDRVAMYEALGRAKPEDPHYQMQMAATYLQKMRETMDPGYLTRAAKLVDAELSFDVTSAICRRILIGQTLYALGALLCVVSTHLSIAFIVLVQLNYAVAPRFWRKREAAE